MRAAAAALLAPGLKLCASGARARVSCPSSSRLPLHRIAAMASAPNPSFRPEEARSPPALELPTPPLSKVTPIRFGFLRA
jgi:omega-amidase